MKTKYHSQTIKAVFVLISFIAAGCWQYHVAAQVGTNPNLIQGNKARITSFTAFNYFKKQADEGNNEAMFVLAGAYMNGDHTNKDTALGMAWLEKAANANHAGAMNNLAVFMQQKRNKADSVKAFLWFLSSANLGNSTAMMQVGNAYRRGTEVAKDSAEGLKWYIKSADNGNGSAMYWLALRFDNGREGTKDSSLALYWYKKGAEAGNSNAQNNLGIKYRKGRWVEKNYSKAIQLFKQSAEDGNPFGMYNLGVMYEYGKGVEQNYEKALKLYRESAEKTKACASNNKMGKFYESGLGGLPVDYTEAIKWYKRSEEKGDALYAICRIGYFYETGKGFEKDVFQAMKWYRKAADNDNGFGMLHVGNLYEQAKDITQADIWYKKAAAWFEKDIAKTLDDTESMIALGEMYEKGIGVEKNLQKAKELYQQAAELGDESAKLKLREF